jgi:protein-S-isoprenylcysteine O-methyltransferase Ste14
VGQKQNLWGIGPRMLLAAAGYAVPAGVACWLWPDACLVRAVPYPVFLAAGGLLLLVGVPLLVVAGRAATAAWQRDELATSGIFGLVRHPIYSAWIIFLLPGPVLLTASWPLLPTPLAAYLAFKRLIGEEDEYLERRFGQVYLDYRARVNELAPVPRGAGRHFRAVLLLPFVGAVVVPGTLLCLTGPDTLGLWSAYPATAVVLPVLGGVLGSLGLALVAAAVGLFAAVGQGTLAPWDPPRRLVVRGVYRHVRNPMISGVSLVLLGEAVAAASLPLLGWFALFVVVNLIYLPLSEEPGLARRFGEAYREYSRNVPRWVPRLRAWEGGADGARESRG